MSELSGKSEVLDYLRRNKIEPSYTALRKRLRKGLRNGSISQEVVTEYTRRTKPIPAPRTKQQPRVRPIPPPRTPRTKPIPPPRRDKKVSCTHGTLEEINGVTFCILCGLENDYCPYQEHPQNKEPRGLTFRRASTREQRKPVLPPRTKPIPPPENVSMVSKYQKARIIGVRARQIADGAQPRCSVEGLTSSLDIATREFEQGLTVFKRQSETKEGI